MKAIKFLVYLAIFGAVLVFGGQFFAGYYAKDQIERVASQSFGAKVAVGSVRLSLLKGYGEINGLSIASPEGYRAGEALGVDSVSFDLDPMSLLSSPIRVEGFAVQHARAVYELDERGKGNLNVLLENLSAASNDGATDTPDTTEPAEPAAAKNISIGSVSVANTALTLDLQSMGKKRYEETLPEFTAENVGGEAGLPPAALGKEIVRVMLSNILKEAETKYKARIKSQLKDKLMQGIGGKLEGLLDKL